MQFPFFALHDCVIILEIYKGEVERFIKDLFRIDIILVIGIWHLLLGKGIKLISNIFNPKITLKGVKDKVIIRTISPKIYKVITASWIYRQELEEEGNSPIEYVSMIFTSKSSEGAYINIYLDLKGGLWIKDILYN